jgi:hypothetical protein
VFLYLRYNYIHFIVNIDLNFNYAYLIILLKQFALDSTMSSPTPVKFHPKLPYLSFFVFAKHTPSKHMSGSKNLLPAQQNTETNSQATSSSQSKCLTTPSAAAVVLNLTINNAGFVVVSSAYPMTDATTQENTKMHRLTSGWMKGELKT